jgi:hypothetical protein
MLVATVSSVAVAEEPSGEAVHKIDFFALPIELDMDSGATNGDANILRLLPLYSIALGKNARLVNLNLVTFANTPGGVPGRPGNPDALPGGYTTGISDLIHASLYTPDASKKTSFGIGGMLSIPIASDDVLGTGKWAAGPALRFSHKGEKWNIGVLGGQLWSFAGDTERSDTSQLMIRAVMRRQLANDWFVVSSPIITANWRVEKGQKWQIPLGGGIGKQFEVGDDPWNFSVQAYYNAIKPDGAPNYSIRLSLVTAIPFD